MLHEGNSMLVALNTITVHWRSEVVHSKAIKQKISKKKSRARRDYESGGAMSESPFSDMAGANCNILIFVCGLGAVTAPSGCPGEPARDGTTDPTADAAFEPFPRPFPTGADADPPLPNLPRTPGFSSTPFTAAYSDSFSPTHVFANHLPPAIPRISLFAVRQCRTCFFDLSRVIGGA